MNDVRLKPCPFCGQDNAELESINRIWRVHCNNCFATSAMAIKATDAISAWNTRRNTSISNETMVNIRSFQNAHEMNMYIQNNNIRADNIINVWRNSEEYAQIHLAYWTIGKNVKADAEV